jgi:hypothetical protein
MAPLVVLSLLAMRPQKSSSQPQFLGEHVTAEITCLNIPVATATLVVTMDSLAESGSVYHLAVSAKTSRFYSLIYRVNNRYDSYFTWPDVRTLRYERHIEESGFDLHRTVTYQDTLAHYSGEEPMAVPAQKRDLFLSLYALRGEPLHENQVIDTAMDLDGQLWTVRARSLGQERIETRHGTFQAIKVEVRYFLADETREDRGASDILTNNLVKEKTKVIIWFSDDEHKIPLKAHCHVSPLTIKAVFSTDQ